LDAVNEVAFNGRYFHVSQAYEAISRGPGGGPLRQACIHVEVHVREVLPQLAIPNGR
jgi:hypothetical protein